MNWKGVCIHHSLTEDSDTRSWEAIRKYHIHTNGWDEIGYHFGIEDVEGRIHVRIGRPTNMQGAHAPSLNQSHIGICVVGNYDGIPPCPEYIRRLVLLIHDLSIFYKFPINYESIRFHNEVAHKTCPGKLFPAKSEIIKMVNKLN